MWLLFYLMSKYVKLLLQNGEVLTFEIITPYPIDYPIMCSIAENRLAAELDFHKMRILAENYRPVYHDKQKIVSMKVSANNIKVYLLIEPEAEECVNLIDIWSGFMQMGYCEVLKSNLFK